MSIGSLRHPESPDEKTGRILSFSKGLELNNKTSTGGGGGDPPDDLKSQRKHAAKSHNEMVKLFASGMNALAVASIVAAVVVPALKGLEAYLREAQPVWYFVGIGLHVTGLAALGRLMRSED